MQAAGCVGSGGHGAPWRQGGVARQPAERCRGVLQRRSVCSSTGCHAANFGHRKRSLLLPAASHKALWLLKCRQGCHQGQGGGSCQGREEGELQEVPHSSVLRGVPPAKDPQADAGPQVREDQVGRRSRRAAVPCLRAHRWSLQAAQQQRVGCQLWRWSEQRHGAQRLRGGRWRPRTSRASTRPVGNHRLHFSMCRQPVVADGRVPLVQPAFACTRHVVRSSAHGHEIVRAGEQRRVPLQPSFHAAAASGSHHGSVQRLVTHVDEQRSSGMRCDTCRCAESCLGAARGCQQP